MGPHELSIQRQDERYSMFCDRVWGVSRNPCYFYAELFRLSEIYLIVTRCTDSHIVNAESLQFSQNCSPRVVSRKDGDGLTSRCQRGGGFTKRSWDKYELVTTRIRP